jgi:type I restriction enzyme M protein
VEKIGETDMIRADMVATVGREYLTSNIENDEYSYPKAFAAQSLTFNPIRNKTGRAFEKLDIRFVKDNVTVLIETKQNFTVADEEQLSAYVEYEKALTGNKIIAILANTANDNVKVWRGVISDGDLMPKETALRTMDEYVDFYTSKINDKEKVMQNTYKLNEMLHRHSIPEKLRSQFVGTCLLALKNGLDYSTPSLTAAQIRTRIKEVLEDLLNSDINKAEKLALLNRNVLGDQYVRQLNIAAFREILKFIEDNILPFINDKSTSGQDLLNLFFVTFNKYVGKSDKNQAFTPDHVTDFMAKITGVNKHSVVLDPCCGSGSFLVRAMTQALDDCATAAEQEEVKKHQIFGIEFDENVYGLATTNMLIHSDGNSNIRQGSCFALADWIKEAKPNVILMNPPYNGQRIHLPKSYVDTWARDKKEDPSKGLYFVKYIADTLNSINHQAKLAVLLPVACAIGTSGEIARLKREILEENTLDAVFTLPNEIFYPGASASACCMVFKIGIKHTDISNPDTFFGYCKDDGFKKKKNLGRVEQVDSTTGKSRWVEIEKEWIELYRNRRSVDGLSATHKVSGDDEWLCEAYMKTDYTKLTERDFQQTINDYLAYLVKEGYVYES